MTNNRTETSGTNRHMLIVDMKTFFFFPVATESYIFENVYHLCLHFKQVSFNLADLCVPHKSPKGPTNKNPQHAFIPLKPFLPMWYSFDPHFGHFTISFSLLFSSSAKLIPHPDQNSAFIELWKLHFSQIFLGIFCIPAPQWTHFGRLGSVFNPQKLQNIKFYLWH